MNHVKTAIATTFAMALAMSSAFAQTTATQASPGNRSAEAQVGGSGTFSGWLSDYQTQHQGRISRKAYMDEVGRRWDQADKDKRGLTTDQINQTYGMGATGPTLSTAPGNMGPNDVKK